MTLKNRLLAASFISGICSPGHAPFIGNYSQKWEGGRQMGAGFKDGEQFRDASGNTYVKKKGTIRKVSSKNAR